MPTEQALPCEGGLEVGGGIEDHLHHPLDVAIHWSEGPDVHAEAARQARSDGRHGEMLALDGTGLDCVLGESSQGGFVARGHPNVFEASEEQPLGMAHLGQGPGEGSEVVAPIWPIRCLQR